MFIRKIPNVKWNVIQAFFCTSTRHGNSCFLRKLTALPIKKIPTTTQRAHKKKEEKKTRWWRDAGNFGKEAVSASPSQTTNQVMIMCPFGPEFVYSWARAASKHYWCASFTSALIPGPAIR